MDLPKRPRGRPPKLRVGGEESQGPHKPQEAGSIPAPATIPTWNFKLLVLQGKPQDWSHSGDLLTCLALRDYFASDSRPVTYEAEISYDGKPIFSCYRKKHATSVIQEATTIFLPVKK
jgi:hypothetical protein